MNNYDLDPEMEREIRKEELEWEKAVTDWQADSKAEREYYEQLEREQIAWKLRWPGHCPKCGGWGMFFVPGKLTGPPENCYPDESYPCEHLSDDKCHRCGGHLIEDNGNAVCDQCHWSFNDGIPEFIPN